jgi:hypothetical protein
VRAEAAAIALAAALALSACGADAPTAPGPAATLARTDSSWSAGQPPLTASAAYLAVAARAQTLGDLRFAERERTLELIDARRIARQQRHRRDVARRFREIRRRAFAHYREAIRVAARRRDELDAQRRRRLAEARRQREALRRKLHVAPGEECSIAEIREQFDCVSGKLPSG